MKIWKILNKTCNCKEKGSFEVKNIEITMASRSKPLTFSHDVPICKMCDLPHLDQETRGILQGMAKEQIIEKHGLLRSEEIKAIRKGLKMSRDQFGEYLHVLPLSIYMWEKRGRIQNKSSDELIRLKCDSKYLAEHEEEINRIILRRNKRAV